MKKVKKIRKTKKMSSAQLARMTMKTVRVWMTCSVTNCTNEVLVDDDVVSVKCSICTLEMAPLPKHLMTQKKKSEKPAGWRFMKLFVDKDGNVYHTGVEQPKLKGTLKLSDVDKIREDQKKKREETKKKKALREKLKEERLVRQHAKAKKAKKKDKDKKEGKVTKKKKVIKKKKVTKGKVKYEKFEEPRIATDRDQIQKFLESESIFAEKLSTRQIEVESIVKIARSSYAAIDRKTGVVKNKRHGYKITLADGNTNIINISIK